MNLYTKQKQIHRHTTNSWLTNGKVGKDKLGVWINIHTLCACMLSHLVMSDSFWFHGLKPTRLLCPWTGMSCHFLLQGIFLTQGLNLHFLHFLYWSCVGTKWLQSWPTVCDTVDCSPPGSSVHGILQTRILDWVAIPYSRGSSWPRDWTHFSYVSCFGRQVLYH